MTTAHIQPLSKNGDEHSLAEVLADPGRARRTGVAEVIFGQGKTPDQIGSAIQALSVAHPVLVTRLTPQTGEAIASGFPSGCWWPEAGLFCLGRDIRMAQDETSPEVCIVTAGTTDLPVAWEALGSARFFGLRVTLTGDVGVAGLHRLSAHLPLLRQARVVIAVAGMEGALPSVLGGLLPAPIIAVPTSVGYGAAFSGLTPLLAMLNSCAPGVGVVNIDNGFGAAALAKKILRPHA